MSSVRQVKIWVTDLDRSRTWYETSSASSGVLGFEDRDGVIRGMAFRVPDAAFGLALRANPELAVALTGFALTATGDSLDAWCPRASSAPKTWSGSTADRDCRSTAPGASPAAATAN